MIAGFSGAIGADEQKKDDSSERRHSHRQASRKPSGPAAALVVWNASSRLGLGAHTRPLPDW